MCYQNKSMVMNKGQFLGNYILVVIYEIIITGIWYSKA